MIGTKTFPVSLLLERLAQHGDLCAESVRQFHSHMPQPTQSDDRDLFPGSSIPVLQRRIKCDTCAQQWRTGIERQILGHTQRIILVDDNLVGIAAVGRLAFFIAAVISPDRRHRAVLLEALPALRTRPARVDEAAHADLVSDLIFRDLISDRFDNPCNLMPRNHRKDRLLLILAPFVPRLMNVRMANAAIFNVDHDVVLARLAAFERIRSKRSSRLQCGISLALAHDSSLYRCQKIG